MARRVRRDAVHSTPHRNVTMQRQLGKRGLHYRKAKAMQRKRKQKQKHLTQAVVALDHEDLVASLGSDQLEALRREFAAHESGDGFIRAADVGKVSLPPPANPSQMIICGHASWSWRASFGRLLLGPWGWAF